jgi:hypothetical protein
MSNDVAIFMVDRLYLNITMSLLECDLEQLDGGE